MLLNTLLPRLGNPELTAEQMRIVAENDIYVGAPDFCDISADDVLVQVPRLRCGKAPDRDGLTNEILREAIAVCPEMFAFVFNACFRQGVFPEV